MSYADIIWKLVEKLLDDSSNSKKTNDSNNETKD